jgi:hypothetical protein
MNHPDRSPRDLRAHYASTPLDENDLKGRIQRLEWLLSNMRTNDAYPFFDLRMLAVRPKGPIPFYPPGEEPTP